MKNLLSGLIPIQLALSVGSMRVFAISMFDRDDEDEEQVVVNAASTAFGFALEPVDELEPRLEPLEDDDATREED